MTIATYCRRHIKVVALSAGGLLILLGVVAWMRASSHQAKYLTTAVRRGDITAAVQVTGTINPLTTVPVGSYVSGTVRYVFADFNTRVRAGQVLAQLDPAIYEAQVLQARGNLANAGANVQRLEASVVAMVDAVRTSQANLSRSQAALDYARVNSRRVAGLTQEGILSKDQNDLTQSGLEQAAAQVRASQAELTQSQAQLNETRQEVQQAKAQLEAAQGAVKQAETNLRYTTILSPIDGTIVARNVTVGQSVAASLQAPVVFSIAQDLNRMQVYAKTDESDTGSIKIGADVTFQVDAYPAQVFHGRVSTIRLNAYAVQNVVTYDTVVDFENPDERLLPGETAYVTIPTGQASDTLKIPSAALRFIPQVSSKELQDNYARFHIPAAATHSHVGGWQVVWKLTPARKLEPAAIKIGITDYSFTQLLEGDLKEGDLLVTDQEASPAMPQPPGQFSGAPRLGGSRR